jgi:hypothetical protein
MRRRHTVGRYFNSQRMHHLPHPSPHRPKHTTLRPTTFLLDVPNRVSLAPCRPNPISIQPLHRPTTLSVSVPKQSNIHSPALCPTSPSPSNSSAFRPPSQYFRVYGFGLAYSLSRSRHTAGDTDPHSSLLPPERPSASQSFGTPKASLSLLSSNRDDSIIPNYRVLNVVCALVGSGHFNCRDR